MNIGNIFSPSPIIGDLGKLLIKKKEYGKKIRKTISK